MKRFYKATDGHITVYRATERTYAGAIFGSVHLGPADGPGILPGWYRRGSIGFSAKLHGAEHHPVEEIVQSEYETLIALRNTWLQCRGVDLKNYTSPQDSWLPNATIDSFNRTVGWAERTDGYEHDAAKEQGPASRDKAVPDYGDDAVKTYPHDPSRCPSNHWNPGDDICADCGTHLG